MYVRTYVCVYIQYMCTVFTVYVCRVGTYVQYLIRTQEYMNNTYMCGKVSTVYALIFAGLNFRGLPIFAVCDIIAQVLPVWFKFSQDETFADGY